MQASIGQYSIHAGDPAQPVQQSVVIARMRGFFLRVALPSPSDMGQCFSTMSKMFCSSNSVMSDTLTQCLFGTQSAKCEHVSPPSITPIKLNSPPRHKDTNNLSQSLRCLCIDGYLEINKSWGLRSI